MSLDDPLSLINIRLKVVAVSLLPSICKRGTGEARNLQELGIHVSDWFELKQNREMLQSKLHGMTTDDQMQQDENRFSRSMVRTTLESNIGTASSGPSAIGSNINAKAGKTGKAKGNATGRTYTSKFRGVHQTFPTKRWEAQFRRNGKPTSLGCFDHEEEAARAYDKMMLWCEIHQATGLKSGITNFDMSVYDDEGPWLKQCSQDELIDSLRSEGRKQAQHRMLRAKKGQDREE